MKKKLLAALILAAPLVQAHELWVNAPAKNPAGDVVKAEIGYGHEFPTAEPIEADRIQIFKPLQLVGLDGKVQNMNQQGENYQYVTPGKVEKGAYWVNAVYQPTFWSKNDKGWKQQSLKEMPDASTCQQAQMFGKALVVVGEVQVDVSAVSKPIGQMLEIMPLADPSQIKAGALFPLQVYYDGKPLAGASVIATSDTFMEKDWDAVHDDRPPQAFSGKTDKDGKINLIPLIEGLWKIKVSHEQPFADQKVCTKSSFNSSLILPIGEKRAAPHEHEHHHH